MNIVIRELREGSNPIAFAIPATQLAEIAGEVDDLYSAVEDGAVDFDLQKFEELMYLRGTVHAPLTFECARCLADRERELTIPISWTLLPKDGQGDDLSAKEELELTTDDLDTSFYAGEEIDLSEMAREAILLALEPIPRCAEDEACGGVDLEATEAEAPETPKEDPRWAPLKKLLEQQKKD